MSAPISDDDKHVLVTSEPGNVAENELAPPVLMPQAQPIPSKKMRALLIVVSYLHVALAGAVVLGSAPLNLMLQKEGTFLHTCAADEPVPCAGQTWNFEIIATAGICAQYMSQLVTGFVLDRIGPKLTAIGASVISALGFALMAFANDSTFPAFVPAVILMAIGGPPLQLSTIHLTNLFPAWKSLLKAGNSGFFLFSSLLFTLFLQLIEQGLTRKILFLAYIPVIACIGISALILWPSKPFSEKQVLAVDSPRTQTQTVSTTAPSASPAQDSLLSQMLSLPYLLMTLNGAISIWRLNYIGASMSNQLASLGDAEPDFLGPFTYSRVFSYISPLGIIGNLLMGVVLDKLGLTAAFILCYVDQLAVAALLLVPLKQVQLVTFVLFACSRPFMFTTNYAFIGARYGMKNFGVLSGLVACSIGLLAILNVGLAKLATGVLNRNYAPINIAFFIIQLVQVLYLVFVIVDEKSQKHKHMQTKPTGRDEMAQGVDIELTPVAGIDTLPDQETMPIEEEFGVTLDEQQVPQQEVDDESAIALPSGTSSEPFGESQSSPNIQTNKAIDMTS